MKTIPDLCHQRACLSGSATAFVDTETGIVRTFADVDAECGRIAHLLGELGARPGDRIAVLCHNTAVFFPLLFACARARLILVPLNWRQTVAELAPVVEDCAARLLLFDAPNTGLAEALGSIAGIERTALASLEAEARRPGPTVAPCAWDGETPWYLLYTSGTTGSPKAVIQTATMAVANAVNVQTATGIGAHTRALDFLPLFHTAGINLHTMPIFLSGGTSRVVPKFDAGVLLEAIAGGEVTVFFGVPQIYQALSLHPEFGSCDLSRVDHWGCGGAPLSAPLIEMFLGRGVTICNGMGMTETGPTVFFMDRASAASKIGSVGKPQLLAEVRLVGADGLVVGPGASGELQFRGPGITPGYFGNEAATIAAFDDGGWLRSGDVGRMDEDGYFYIVDRIKDMYISGGENVYPAEVEAVLARHPGVLEAVIVGVPDARWGEVGHAVLIPRPGATIDEAAVVAHARAHLAAYKVPRHVTVMAELPRAATGKVRKHLLRDLLSEATP